MSTHQFKAWQQYNTENYIPWKREIALYEMGAVNYSQADITREIKNGWNISEKLDEFMQAVPQTSDLYKYFLGVQSSLRTQFESLEKLKSNIKTNNPFIVDTIRLTNYK